MVRKAVIEIGKYLVKEGPTGGWRVFVDGMDEPISIHNDKPDAVAAAKRYVAGDKRRMHYFATGSVKGDDHD